ncbi:heat shock 70 kDa protein 12A-like [Astyanax mexicanus]|uniref:Heat shock 70 kDa protein 12A-like n=1 Tax=Astyanax mexicanus TaxID=7994 RepID=A0A8T2LLJ3_ASTMX|nr:heat shock 70 kDa protein 12A-like [Astyanax mexicanus]
MAYQQTNQPNLYSDRFKFGQKQEELDTLRQENENLKSLYHKSRDELQESKSELLDFKQRMGKFVDLTLGSSGVLSEDITNPCRESELRMMYKKLSKNDWAKFIRQLKKGVPEGTAGQPKELRKQAEQKIKAVLRQSQEDIETIMSKMKRITTSRQEQPENTMPAKHFDLAIQEFQMAIYQKKNGCYNTDELQDIPDVLHPMIEECYKIGCLMALHNPPLLFDFDNSEQGTFPPIKTDVIRKTEPFSSPVDLHSNQPPLENLDPPEGSQKRPCDAEEFDKKCTDPKVFIAIDFGTEFSGYSFDNAGSKEVCLPVDCGGVNTNITDAEKVDEKCTEPTVFIAIDLGTEFSGYCFRIAGSKEVWQPKWGEEYGFNTPKTPTCILFDENEKFLEFGYGAGITYTRQTQKDEAKKLYLFENFKRELHGKELNRDFMLTARNGKQMRAMKVFSESLRFMKDHALEMIRKHTSRVKYSASDATWILMVPATWSAAAKQFMREAATEAGLVKGSEPDRLIIALEHEAASVWCRQLPSEGFMKEDLIEAEAIKEVPGTKYMVVDCGGVNINITVHEVMEGGHLKELNWATKIFEDGKSVDKHFKEYLRKKLSKKMCDGLEEKHPSDLQKLMYDYNGDMKFLSNLEQLVRKVEDKGASSRGSAVTQGRIIQIGDKLKLLHDKRIKIIESQIREILTDCKLNINYMVLVGGFALSPYVNSLLRERFEGRCKVLCPVDAQMAVLRGAVTFGMRQNVVESRISRYSYGVRIVEEFDQTRHRDKRKCVTKEVKGYCNVCFHCLVKKDESVSFDKVSEFNFTLIERDQKPVQLILYCTENKSARLVDERGMVKIGSLTVSMPENKAGRPRLVKLQVKVGCPEMQATVIDVNTGEIGSVKLDLMSK